MKRILSLIFVLLVVITSCKQNYNQKKNEKIKNNIDSSKIVTKILDEEKVNIVTDKLKPFVVFNSCDTLFVPDTGKVYNIRSLGNEIYYYTLFESIQDETDNGKKILMVRNNKNELLWNLILEDYISLTSNKKQILIAYYEKDLLKYFDCKDGNLLRSISLNHNLSDGNEILTTDKDTYIKLINDEDATTTDVIIINNGNFEKKLLNLNLNDYYSLRIEKGKVFLENENERRYLN